MPEGPEIRRAADRVAAALVGRVAERVEFGLDRLRYSEQVLTGREVVEVTSHGKAMLTRFAGDLTVYSHNQLYGRWYVRRRDELPETGRQLRFAVHTNGHSALLYSASEIEVLDRDGERDHPFLSRLGPDPLDDTVHPEQLALRMAAPRFRRRGLGALLLDQRFVAGLGNYLRADILFAAGIHPATRPADLDDRSRARLAEAVVEVARRSYATGGITVDPELDAELKARGIRRKHRRHWVYGRSGQPCRRCGGEVVDEPIGGRRCYFCPRCQPPPSRGP